MANLPVLRKRAYSGALVPPNVAPPSIVYAPPGRGGAGTSVDIAGGYWWGGGPRVFVGGSRGPEVVEVGRPGDFVEGAHVWGPADGDLGFPHSTRWPGYPGQWEQPFYATVPGQPPTAGGYGAAGGFGSRFLGGAMLEGRVSTVFACTDLIGRSLSTFPIITSKDSVAIPNPPWTENPEPEIYTSMVDAMKCIVNSALIRGESFVAPTARYADGTVARWVVLNPDVVQVDATGGLPQYAIEGVGPVARSEILHIRYQVWPGLVHGVGPLEAAWRNLLSADALERWGTELALTHGIPTAILQSAAKLTKDQAREIKNSWAEATLSRGTLPAVLSGGLTYTPLNLKPSDMGLLDLRTFDEARIASVFGVPLWFVGLPMADGLTYTTVEGTFDYLWRATLRSLSFNIMQALSNFCLPRGVKAWHRAEAFVQPNMNERAQAYKALIESGVITRDEARLNESLHPLDSTSTKTLATNLNASI